MSLDKIERWSISCDLPGCDEEKTIECVFWSGMPKPGGFGKSRNGPWMKRWHQDESREMLFFCCEDHSDEYRKAFEHEEQDK